MLDLSCIDHFGIRITDETRSTRFYEKLGFVVVERFEDQKVTILRHPSGIEINFIINAQAYEGGLNVLMDAEHKYPGITHVALQVADVALAQRRLEALNIPLSDGPVQLGDGISVFLRDPDRNVIELRQPL